MDEKLSAIAPQWAQLNLHLQLRQLLIQHFTRRDPAELKAKVQHYNLTHDGETIWLILDLDISRQVLKRPEFETHNLFRSYQRTSDQPSRQLDSFFQHTLLYNERQDHRDPKKRMVKKIQALMESLPALEKALQQHFESSSEIDSALEFAETVIHQLLSLLIHQLTGIELLRVQQGLRKRQNLFQFMLLPSVYEQMAELFEELFDPDLLSQQLTDRWLNQHLAQVLMVNGYDPLVGSLCACMAAPTPHKFGDKMLEIAAVSYTHRRCQRAIKLKNLEFSPGDLVFLSLVPGANGETSIPLSFGLGPHACVGKRLSQEILNLAQRLLLRYYPSGFQDQLEIFSEGSFLKYRSTSQT